MLVAQHCAIRYARQGGGWLLGDPSSGNIVLVAICRLPGRRAGAQQVTQRGNKGRTEFSATAFERARAGAARKAKEINQRDREALVTRLA